MILLILFLRASSLRWMVAGLEAGMEEYSRIMAVYTEALETEHISSKD